MQNKECAVDGFMKILTFVLNSICFGIPIRNVEYTEPIEGEMYIHKMSNTPDYIKGLAMLHGVSIPVYSLTSMFGFTDRELKSLVVINVNGMKLAFEVEGECKIIDVGEKEIFPLPACLGMSKCYFKNIVVYSQKQLIFLIDVNELV